MRDTEWTGEWALDQEVEGRVAGALSREHLAMDQLLHHNPAHVDHLLMPGAAMQSPLAARVGGVASWQHSCTCRAEVHKAGGLTIGSILG